MDCHSFSMKQVWGVRLTDNTWGEVSLSLTKMDRERAAPMLKYFTQRWKYKTTNQNNSIQTYASKECSLHNSTIPPNNSNQHEMVTNEHTLDWTNLGSCPCNNFLTTGQNSVFTFLEDNNAGLLSLFLFNPVILLFQKRNIHPSTFNGLGAVFRVQLTPVDRLLSEFISAYHSFARTRTI